MTIKDLVKDNVVEFQFFKKGLFYYAVTQYTVTEPDEDGITEPDVIKAWQFTIPLEDIGDATLLKQDKALTYMRWIRKAMDSNTLIEIK